MLITYSIRLTWKPIKIKILYWQWWKRKYNNISCETNHRFLSTVDNIYMDGTFDYSARLFLNFFLIHGYFNIVLIFDVFHCYYVSLVFCLLPNKCKQTYTYAFRAISKKCKDLRLNFSPTNITVDFKRAIII
jgi:hypothetical protein